MRAKQRRLLRFPSSPDCDTTNCNSKTTKPSFKPTMENQTISDPGVFGFQHAASIYLFALGLAGMAVGPILVLANGARIVEVVGNFVSSVCTALGERRWEFRWFREDVRKFLWKKICRLVWKHHKVYAFQTVDMVLGWIFGGLLHTCKGWSLAFQILSTISWVLSTLCLLCPVINRWNHRLYNWKWLQVMVSSRGLPGAKKWFSGVFWVCGTSSAINSWTKFNPEMSTLGWVAFIEGIIGVLAAAVCLLKSCLDRRTAGGVSPTGGLRAHGERLEMDNLDRSGRPVRAHNE